MITGIFSQYVYLFKSVLGIFLLKGLDVLWWFKNYLSWTRIQKSAKTVEFSKSPEATNSASNGVLKGRPYIREKYVAEISEWSNNAELKSTQYDLCHGSLHISCCLLFKWSKSEDYELYVSPSLVSLVDSSQCWAQTSHSNEPVPRAVAAIRLWTFWCYTGNPSKELFPKNLEDRYSVCLKDHHPKYVAEIANTVTKRMITAFHIKIRLKFSCFLSMVVLPTPIQC